MHTENMYSQPEDQLDRRRLLHRRTEDEPTPLVEEVREAMKKLKNKKWISDETMQLIERKRQLKNQ